MCACLLDLPRDVLDKINGYVIQEKNKDLLEIFFFNWKEMITYYVYGDVNKHYILRKIN
jgi:hypothetical protein